MAYIDEFSTQWTHLSDFVFLFLMCSGAKVRNASLFRTHLMAAIPDIFESLRTTHRAIESRLTASTMRDRVNDVLKAWEAWSIFSIEFLFGLESTMMAAEPPPTLVAEIVDDDLDLAELKKTCKLQGLSLQGAARDLMIRHMRVDEHKKKIRPSMDHFAGIVSFSQDQ